MLRKRIIFTLIYADGYFMQSRNFRLQRVGDLKWLEKNYHFQNIAFSIDELIVLDASRGTKSIQKLSTMLSHLVDDIFIPLTAGGGIRSIEDAEILFNNGADKILLNTILSQDINLVRELVSKYGSQSIVASIDYRNVEGINTVYYMDGTQKCEMTLIAYIEYLESLNIGEIYLNSIDRDGTGFGFDLDTISQISSIVNKPLIIAGGAGNENHLQEGLRLKGVSAVATANLFNFIGNGLPFARRKLIELGENLAIWNNEQFKKN
jgi:cyclase